MRQLEQLNELLVIKLRVEERAYKRLTARETVIRGDLERLSDQARQAQQTTTVEMKAIGADISWQAWLGRSAAALNLQLAEVLAQKGSYVEQVRKAHGKVSISDELLAREQAERRQLRAKRLLDDLADQFFGANSKPLSNKQDTFKRSD
jgi:hypothetical protein